MPKKNIISSGVVYSTDKDFKFREEKEEDFVIAPGEQKLFVRLDTKHRGGKAVTIIEGYQGSNVEETGKKLKVFCGTGGSVKDGQIIVQGDNRDKVTQWLMRNGFKIVKKA